MSLPPLRLKKSEERRLRAGHLWIYSNEVDTAATPLTAFAPGAQVQVETHTGRALGCAYVNPHSLIAARLFSRDAHVLDRSLLVHRLNIALALREKLYSTPHYRLVHGEGDELPGLVVDRYGDWLVVQLTTAGMEAVRDAVIEALVKVLSPQGILLRNDSSMRALEGLSESVELVHGEVPERLRIEEDGIHIEVAPFTGQKTGWFYDQRENRRRLRRYTQGARVLDLFSYAGGWGLHAAAGGAREVTCVDASAEALAQVNTNAALNGWEGRVRTERGDVFEVLRQLREAGERFDVVVLDPPAFIKRKRDFDAGLEAYRRANQLAMQVLARDGWLVSGSCSYHLPRETLQKTLLAASRHLDRRLQLLEHGYQGPDHPIHPAIPETDYLKALFTRVLPV